jgi:hypothetical protein
MSGDLPVGQALRAQGQHHLLDPVQPPLAFAHDLRLEAAVPVTGHFDLDRSDVGGHRLGPASVAGVGGVLAGRVVLVIAEVVGDLTFQSRLQHPLGQLLQQPTLTDQIQALLPGLSHQLPDQILGRISALDLLAGLGHRGVRLRFSCHHQ